MADVWLHYESMGIFDISSYHISKTRLDQIIFHTSKPHSVLSCHMLSVTLKSQMSTSRPGAMLKTIFGSIFDIFENILMRQRPFSRVISYSSGAMSRSILANVF